MAEPLTPEMLSQEQQAVLDAALRPGAVVLVQGGPGTGKTSTLLSLALTASEAGIALENQLILTGSRAQAQRLRTVLMKSMDRAKLGLQITTVHGWAAGLLAKIYQPEEPPRLLTAPQQDLHVREILAESAVQWPKELRQALPTAGFVHELRKLVAKARQLGMDPAELSDLGRRCGRADWQAAGEFFAEYLTVLDAEQVIDYNELITRCRLKMADDAQLLAEAVAGARLILCDEFSELDYGMINILADLVDGGSKLVAFADPDTQIYGFRGADSAAVSQFRARFAAPGRVVEQLRLTHNYRASDELAGLFDGFVRRIPAVGGGRLVAKDADQSASEVIIEALTSGDELRQANVLAAKLRALKAKYGYRWADMAVIVRGGQAEVSQLASRLSQLEIPVQAAGAELALADEYAVSILLRALSVLISWASDEDISANQLVRLLRGPLGGLDALSIRQLASQLRQNGADKQLSDRDLLAKELLEPVVLLGLDSDYAKQALALHELLRQAAELIKADASPLTVLYQLWAKTDWPQRLRNEALSGSDSSARANRDLDAVIALFDVAERSNKLAGVKGIKTLLADVADQQIAGDTKREVLTQVDRLEVLSVYRTKGRSWPLVVVAGLEEGHWPAKFQAPGLLGAEQLGRAGVELAPDFQTQIAGERRLCYLAASRASERVLLVSLVSELQGIRPSRFIDELGAKVIPDDQQLQPVNLAQLVAQLRKVAVAPDSPPALRSAANRQIGWLASQVDDQGRGVVSVADTKRWVAGRQYSDFDCEFRPPELIRLQASNLNDLLTCPRSWFLTRKARASVVQSTAASLGTLLHEIFEKAVSENWGFGEAKKFFDAEWPKLAKEYGWASPGQYDRAINGLTNFFVWHQDGVDAGFKPLGTEVKFAHRFMLDGQEIEFVGSIDRIDRTPDGYVVVTDYKTGKTAATYEETQQNMQLGVYQLMIAGGAVKDHVGDAPKLGGAVLYYPLSGARGAARTQAAMPDDLLDADGQLAKTVWQSAGEPEEHWLRACLVRAVGYIKANYYPAIENSNCQRCPFRLDCPVGLTEDEED